MTKKVSQKNKGSYKDYSARDQYVKNRKRKLLKHLKDYPDDAAAKKALSNIKYRRKKPSEDGGWIDRKDPMFQGVPTGSCRVLAQVKKLSRKVQNELATNKEYKKIMEQFSIMAKNKEQSAVNKPAKNVPKKHFKKSKQKPNK